MLLGITIDSDDPYEVAAALGYYLNGVAQTNRLIMRKVRIPPIYSTSIPYDTEPWKEHWQSLRSCREALTERWMECKTAGAWLLAERREQAPNEDIARLFDLQVSWKDYDRNPFSEPVVPLHGIYRVFHVVVLHPNGKTEDPTRRMRKRTAVLK